PSGSVAEAPAQHQRVAGAEVGRGANEVQHAAENVAGLGAPLHARPAAALQPEDDAEVAVIDRVAHAAGTLDGPGPAAELAGDVAPQRAPAGRAEPGGDLRLRVDQLAPRVLIRAPLRAPRRAGGGLGRDEA